MRVSFLDGRKIHIIFIYDYYQRKIIDISIECYLLNEKKYETSF
jgi:hypothetical protein